MKLSAPKKMLFWIAVIIAVVGIIAKFVNIPFLSMHTFVIVLIAFIVLAIGNLVKGL